MMCSERLLIIDEHFERDLIESVKCVLGNMTKLECTVGIPFSNNKPLSSSLFGDVVGIATMLHGYKSDPDAIFCVTMSSTDIKSHFLPRGIEPSRNNLMDAIGEISNIIFGALKTSLNSRGYDYKPTVVYSLSQENIPDDLNNSHWHHFPFNLGNINLSVHVALLHSLGN